MKRFSGSGLFRLIAVLGIFGVVQGCSVLAKGCENSVQIATARYFEIVQGASDSELRDAAASLREGLLSCSPDERKQLVVFSGGPLTLDFNELAIHALSVDLLDSKAIGSEEAVALMIRASAYGDYASLRAFEQTGLALLSAGDQTLNPFSAAAGGVFERVDKLKLIVDSGGLTPSPEELLQWAEVLAEDGGSDSSEVSDFLIQLSQERGWEREPGSG